MRIRISWFKTLIADLDLAFHLSVDPDPGSQTIQIRADLDPGQQT
jgi:hypothetical protein